MSDEASPVESVDRALRMVALLGANPSGLTLDDLARGAGIPKSSVHRILGALRHRGFAAQSDDGGRYFLGTEMLRVAFAFHAGLDIPALTHPLLLRLRDAFNETVHAGVLDGTDVVYLDKVESSHPIIMASVIGGRNPAHCTGIGKALVAWTYPSDEAVRLWVRSHAPLPARTRHTITSEAKLVEEFARTRERGYALDLEESELGVRCISVPVFLGQSTPAAAISLSAPRTRLSDQRIAEIAPLLRRMVDEAFAPIREERALRGASARRRKAATP